MAPAIGWPRPQRRFCSASARPNTSRPQANSRLIGCTKKPRLERGPKLSRPMMQQQMMMTSGVRQLTVVAERRSPAVVDMSIPLLALALLARSDRTRCTQLMHPHENPQRRHIQKAPRIAAMQIGAVGHADLLATP